jgi:hypothetical protein
MAKELSYKPLDNVGINGLNTQDNSASLSPAWLTKAENILFQEGGQITFRKGLKQKVLATSGEVHGLVESEELDKIFAAIEDDDGNAYMYELDFSSPDTPWTNQFDTTAATADFQLFEWNGDIWGFQDNNAPITYDSSATTWSLQTAITGFQKPTSVSSNAAFQPSCGMGYYGRLWVGGIPETPDTIYYSDLLIGKDFQASGAGSVDLKTVWGEDQIVGIAPFYGKLVIFGRSNIVIYSNPSTPGSLVLDEVIEGIGLAHRDSIQPIGDDLIFLSPTGVRSLARTTEKDNIPLQDYSRNIKDSLIRLIDNNSTIKSCYHEDEGLYLLSFVDSKITYSFDMKHRTPDGSPRVTTFKFNSTRDINSMAFTHSEGFLVGQSGGSIAEYTGYYDKVYVSGGGYTDYAYTGTFATIWVDLGQSVLASILKKLLVIVEGGQGTTVGLKWYVDYDDNNPSTLNFQLNPQASGTPALWGASTSLYGTSKYAPYYTLKEYGVSLSGRAKFIKLEMNALTAGYVASLQDMSLLFKQGKIR